MTLIEELAPAKGAKHRGWLGGVKHGTRSDLPRAGWDPQVYTTAHVSA